jgi:HK97 family phage major capsid protein/HK97 family phage prohead protease
MDQKDKLPTALPMQRVDLVATIVRRKPSAQASLELKAKRNDADPAAQAGDDELDDAELYDISLSSDTPINRGWYTETLDHSKGAVNLDRAATGLNLLWNHDSSQPIGRISNLSTKGGKLSGQMRFFSTPAAQEKRTMVDEGLREVSVGYSVETYEYTPGSSEAGDAYTAKRWTPLEGSLAPVPADHSVGVKARAGEAEFPVSIRSTVPPTPPHAVLTEVITMDETARAAADAAAALKAKLPAAIARLASQHGMADKTAEWLDAGHTVDQVREIILEAKGTRGDQVKPATGTGLDLPAKEAREYSYARAISIAADQAEGKRPANCLELEVSESIERSMPQAYKRHGGLFIPTSLRAAAGRAAIASANVGGGPGISAQARAGLEMFMRTGVVDSVTANALKEVVYTEYGGELIEILRNIAQVVKMGAKVLTGLSSPISFPRQTQDVTASWTQENPGSDMASSNVKTDLVTLTPRTLQASTAYSRQLLVQSSVDVEVMVRGSIAAAHGLAWDLAAMHGTGDQNQPLGIYNSPNVNTVDFGSASFGTSNKIAYTGAVEMERIVAAANALLGTLGFLTTPSIAADAKNTLKFPAAAIAQGGVLWNGTILEGEMDGFVARATNQVSKTLSAGAPTGGTDHGMIFGNWADLLIGQFGGAMELIVDPYTKKKQGLIEVTSFQMCDVAVRHPVSFSVAINLHA